MEAEELDSYPGVRAVRGGGAGEIVGMEESYELAGAATILNYKL
jgi:hypothetical protein